MVAACYLPKASPLSVFAVTKVMNPLQLFVLQIVLGINAQKIKITMRETEYETRNKSDQYFQLGADKRIGQRSFAYLAPRIYAVVPKDLKGRKGSSLKKKLKNWVMEKGRHFFNYIVNPSIALVVPIHLIIVYRQINVSVECGLEPR